MLAALALVALVGTIFDAALSCATAVNRVASIAVGYGLSLALGLALGLLLLPWLGLLAVATALLIAEAGGSATAIYVLRKIIPGIRWRAVGWEMPSFFSIGRRTDRS